jgi:hypothetical protein
MMPKLKIVPVSSIIPLMEYDEDKVNYITGIIENSGTIGNPVSLASIGNRKFLLIDNCELIEAARRLGIKYLPSQVTSPISSVRIDSKIYAEKFDKNIIDNFMDIFPRVAISITGGKRTKNLSRWVRLSVSRQGEGDLNLYFKRYHGTGLPYSMFNFLEYLGHHYRLTRKIFSGRIKTANTKRPDDFTLIRLHGLAFEDLISAAHSYHLFPAGFLRFDYSGRIVGIDFPVRILNEKVTQREKERFLHDLVNYRLNSGHPEYIGGGVYLLNYLAKK